MSIYEDNQTRIAMQSIMHNQPEGKGIPAPTCSAMPKTQREAILRWEKEAPEEYQTWIKKQNNQAQQRDSD